MAKNITLEIIDRLQRLEEAQIVLAEQKVIEAAAAGQVITLAEATAPTVVNRIFRELPVGICNGVNVTFQLAKSPVFKTEEVFLSGCLLRKGINADYLIDYSGKFITMNYPPDADDVLEVNYDFVLNGI